MNERLVVTMSRVVTMSHKGNMTNTKETSKETSCEYCGGSGYVTVREPVNDVSGQFTGRYAPTGTSVCECQIEEREDYSYSN